MNGAVRDDEREPVDKCDQGREGHYAEAGRRDSDQAKDFDERLSLVGNIPLQTQTVGNVAEGKRYTQQIDA